MVCFSAIQLKQNVSKIHFKIEEELKKKGTEVLTEVLSNNSTVFQHHIRDGKQGLSMFKLNKNGNIKGLVPCRWVWFYLSMCYNVT